jgi:hypothetical protein
VSSRRKKLPCALVVCAVLWAGGAAAVAQEDGKTASDAPSTETPDQAETPVDAADSSWRRPLASRNQIPLSLLFVYLTPDRAGTLPPGAFGLELGFDYSNIIQGQESDTERVRLDAEYLRTLLGVRRGLPGGLEVGVSIPFYLYYGGFLDPFVNSFHQSFGLPNFLRGRTPNGLVDLQYSRGEEAVLFSDHSFAAVGDLSFDVKKKLFERNRAAFAVRGILKLPTGNPDSVSGSGAADFGVGAAFDRIGDRFGLYVNANYQFLGTTERIPTRDFFSFMAAVDWRFKPHLAAVLQVDSAGSPIQGELRLLNRQARQLALGLRWRHSEKLSYEWRMVEDLSTFSPDFTFAFQMGVSWKRRGGM